MTFLLSVLKELVGLFVDDGNLALQVVGLIAAVTLLVKGLSLPGLWGAALLLLGCLAILTFSLRRMLRR